MQEIPGDVCGERDNMYIHALNNEEESHPGGNHGNGKPKLTFKDAQQTDERQNFEKSNRTASFTSSMEGCFSLH